MKLVVDMNLPPSWVEYLSGKGHEAVHWSTVGPIDAPDSVIMSWARERSIVVLTHDLDFSALLASTGASGPSVVQVRTRDVMPGVAGPFVVAALDKFGTELSAGAIVSIEPSRARFSVLPLQSESDTEGSR